MKATVIAMWAVCLSLAFGNKLPQSYFQIVKDTFCNVQTLRENTADSELLCAMQCGSDAQCVAYSRRGSQCVLHDEFCSSTDLLSENGAYYARESCLILIM